MLNVRPANRLAVVLITALGLSVTVAHADTNKQVAAVLSARDVYVTPVHLQAGNVKPGDSQRLQREADVAAARGIQEKLAIVSHYPRTAPSLSMAAAGLRNFLDYSGVLIIVAPHGIALGSDILTPAQDAAIANQARPLCLTRGFANCAIFAGQLAVVKARADEDNAFHDAAVFWLVALVAGAVLAAIVLLSVSRRRKEMAFRSGAVG